MPGQLLGRVQASKVVEEGQAFLWLAPESQQLGGEGSLVVSLWENGLS